MSKHCRISIVKLWDWAGLIESGVKYTEVLDWRLSSFDRKKFQLSKYICTCSPCQYDPGDPNAAPSSVLKTVFVSARLAKLVCKWLNSIHDLEVQTSTSSVQADQVIPVKCAHMPKLTQIWLNWSPPTCSQWQSTFWAMEGKVEPHPYYILLGEYQEA